MGHIRDRSGLHWRSVNDGCGWGRNISRSGRESLFDWRVIRRHVDVGSPVEFAVHVLLSFGKLAHSLAKTLGQFRQLLSAKHDEDNQKNNEHVRAG